MPPVRQFLQRRVPAHWLRGRHRHVGLSPEDSSVSGTVQGTQACVGTEEAQRARSLLSQGCPMKNTEAENKFPARWFVNTDTQVDRSQRCLMSVNQSYHCKTHPENPSLTRRVTKATSMQPSKACACKIRIHLRATTSGAPVVSVTWLCSMDKKLIIHCVNLAKGHFLFTQESKVLASCVWPL